jgi:hypothetical protein
MVTQRRGGGRDSRGRPKPETPREVGPVLIGWRSSTDPTDRSQLTDDLAVLYDQSGSCDWLGDDRVEIPTDYPGPHGTWQVEGQPKQWPAGWEVALRRAG